MGNLVDAATILGTLIAVATFMFVLSDWVKERRKVREVMWKVGTWGTSETADGQKLAYVFITNGGRENALIQTIQVMRGSIQVTEQRVVKKWVLVPGDTIDLTVAKYNPEETWLLIQWVPSNDRRYLYEEWFSLSKMTRLSDEEYESGLRQLPKLTRLRKRVKNKPARPGSWKQTMWKTRHLQSEKYLEAQQYRTEQEPTTALYPFAVYDSAATPDRAPESQQDHQ